MYDQIATDAVRLIREDREQPETLKGAARAALEVLEQATAFATKKARDNHPNAVAALRAALGA